jgi:hypothetical protein
LVAAPFALVSLLTQIGKKKRSNFQRLASFHKFNQHISFDVILGWKIHVVACQLKRSLVTPRDMALSHVWNQTAPSEALAELPMG